MAGNHSHDHHDHHDHAHGHEGHSHGGHSHNHAEGADKTRVLIAALLTGGFMVAEAVGGLVTGSLALLADAGHMLTDSVSLVLAWYAFSLAGRAATARMTYGFDRVKTLVAYTNGLTIFAIGIWICWEAVERFAVPQPVLGWPMLAVALVGLGINIAAFFVLHGGDRENLNMRGAMLHVMGDLLGSVAALAAALIIIWTGWYPHRSDPVGARCRYPVPQRVVADEGSGHRAAGRCAVSHRPRCRGQGHRERREGCAGSAPYACLVDGRIAQHRDPARLPQ
ncbi:cation diffusion facilitator family transporter [Mesorhizobium sp. J428]|uniref:cation diffusion facilitator family transporter n=1 Tax=Mesorhizobium sp. J428 TaxID=2898440 RepID=UPI0027E273AC|nr:cation diffusion facilitator family transporter [Mesorhizobium sp. J428]